MPSLSHDCPLHRVRASNSSVFQRVRSRLIDRMSLGGSIRGGAVSELSELGSSSSSKSNSSKSPSNINWEFGGEDEEIFLELLNFGGGGVPTLDEATEATSQLRDALDMMYFPSNEDIGWFNPSKVVKEPIPGYSETKVCNTKEEVVATSPLQKHTSMAFSLLRENQEAQSAVASIASDENVWNAVMKNEKVMEFLKLRKSACLSPDIFKVLKESFRNKQSNEDYKYLKDTVDEANSADSETSVNVAVDVLNNLQGTITQLLKSLFGLFEHIFRSLVSGSNILDTDGKASATDVDKTSGAMFMALGMLTIMIVVLKRGDTSLAVQLMNQQDMKSIHFFLKTVQK